MLPFEALTENDKELIEFYIDRFAPRDDDAAVFSRKESLDIVLGEWNKSKNQLFKLFGEELIVRRLFTYKQTTEGLMREFDEHSNDKEYKNFLNWWNWDLKHNADVKFTLESETSYAFYSKFYAIEQTFDFEALAYNAYRGKDFKIRFEDGTVLKVQTGMKPMKILHKFIEKYGEPEDEEMFEQFRLWHSRFLNQKNVDGELCLSIHPLDYMTMSDNANNWTSCMRWSDKFGNKDPGDYRAGTVECMNSPFIVVAYLHNPNRTLDIEWFKWNSKRWRELFIINDGTITEIKGYPYQDENLTNGCISWLKELANKNMGWTYEDDEYNMRDPQTLIEDDGTETTVYFDFIKPVHMYKDIGCLSKHSGRVNFDILRSSKKYSGYNNTSPNGNKTLFIEIPYGGECTCMFCGKSVNEEGGDDIVLCDACECVDHCAICGDPLGRDIYWIDELEANVCYDCYCDRCIVDSFSEESHLDDSMTPIELLLGYDEYENPIWYNDKIAYCYEPQDNYDYLRVVKGAPLYDYGRNYITIDMMNPDYERAFCDAFEIYPRDIGSFYTTCIDNYNIIYDYQHNPLFEEEPEEED